MTFRDSAPIAGFAQKVMTQSIRAADDADDTDQILGAIVFGLPSEP